LGALRALRGGHAADEQMADELLAKLARGKKTDESHAAPLHGVMADTKSHVDYEQAIPLPAVEFRIATPAVSGAVFKQLGLPPSWGDDPAPLAALEAQLNAGGRLAREWAIKAPEGAGIGDTAPAATR